MVSLQEKKERHNKTNIKLTALFVLLSGLLIVNFFVFSGWSIKRVALALTGNYGKASGQQLTVADWNNLDDDFVAKSGDTMSGVLNMGNQRITGLANPTAGTDAVNRSAMDAAISSAIAAAAPIRDIGGANLRMVCGRTTPGLNWISYPGGAYVDVNMAAAAFTASPYVLTSLGGNGFHAYTRSMTSIYNLSNTGFRIYVMDDSGMPSPFTTYLWYINWCAIGS